MKVTINGRTIFEGKAWKKNEVNLASDEGTVNINFIIDATTVEKNSCNLHLYIDELERR